MIYYTYIVKCKDNSLYTGYTTDLDRRVWEHNNSPSGAKYTRSRRPVELVYHESFSTRSDAMKREYAIKRLSHNEKLNLIHEREDSPNNEIQSC